VRFTALSPECLRHLHLEGLGHGGAHDLAHQVGVAVEQGSPVACVGPRLAAGYGVLPIEGRPRHRMHAMKLRLLRDSPHESGHYHRQFASRLESLKGAAQSLKPACSGHR
jgi:hypothetical protein